MQEGFPTVHLDGVPGIVAPLKANDEVAFRTEHIDDLALSFVAPLGADDDYIGHALSILRAVTQSPRAHGTGDFFLSPSGRASQTVPLNPRFPLWRAGQS